jgi:hypothetical protein
MARVGKDLYAPSSEQPTYRDYQVEDVFPRAYTWEEVAGY